MLLSNCVARLINDWAGCLCGFINDQEECELEARMYDEEKLREIRETRLAMLLQLVLAEEGKELMDHTLQLIDVKLVLSRRI